MGWVYRTLINISRRRVKVAVKREQLTVSKEEEEEEKQGCFPSNESNGSTGWSICQIVGGCTGRDEGVIRNSVGFDSNGFNKNIMI